MGNYLDAMNAIGGKSDYTLEEIKAAEKLKKKNGGTLVENLERVTGRKAAPSLTLDSSFLEHNRAAAEAVDSMGAMLASNQQMLDAQIRELNENLAKDFGVQPAVSMESMAGSTAAEPAPEGEKALEAFDGVAEELGKQIFGQNAFIKKLLIAFKRPYVMPPEGNKAKNSILITGKPDTGKHYALKAVADELAKRRLVSSADCKTVDLGLYPEASMENIFLQDIYAALAGSADIIVFEHLENCHPSFLTHVSSLVTEGSFKLPGRYVMQKGQLVSVQNALASAPVSELTAKGKYLVFISDQSLDKAAGVMGAPFIDALRGDICETEALDEATLTRISERELAELKTRAEKQLTFAVETAEDFAACGVKRAGKQAGVAGVLGFYDSVLEALAQLRLEGEVPGGAKLILREEDGKILAQCGEEEIDLSSKLPGAYRGEVEKIRQELNEIIGLTEVKDYILSLEEYYRVQNRRKEEGLKAGEVNKHMIFTGSPGTGKTTIARIISKYLKAIGVLTGGQLVEVSRADLVGRYVGHTAPLTNQVIKSAIGGVLFIDEAYSLYRGKDDSYGLEAIDTLVKGIEDNRDNLIVILAGYSKEMKEFLTANSGLESRFPNVIDFPDYTGEELLKIACSIAKSKGYVIDEGAHEPLQTYFDGVQATNAMKAGNGRLARNMVEEAILNQSRRLVAEPDAELSTLLAQDFELEKERTE